MNNKYFIYYGSGYIGSVLLRSGNLGIIIKIIYIEVPMNPRNFFPLGKAYDDAFCNRLLETGWLIANIKSAKHSLLIAPRRFGKSSLAERAAKVSKLAEISLNFNTCADEQEIEDLIKQGVAQLIGRAFGRIDKIINSIKQYVTHLTPKVSIGPKYAHLELTANQRNNHAVNIEETLTLIDKLLCEKKRRAIMVMDEFQVVGLIAKGSGVEAAIRNAAQNMNHLAIIFSGSNRHLLQLMFEDELRPLYKLCRKLRLKRIDEEHYYKHLNVAAKLAWKKELAEEVFNQIMLLSDRHPYYVNYLCDIVWTQNTSLPHTEDINKAWLILIEEESSDANAEISRLSMGQKKIVKYIANYSSEQLMSTHAVKILGMALSSIANALTALVEKDIIEKEKNNYKIINPVIKYVMQDSNNIKN